MREMLVLLVVFALGIGAAGANAATIQPSGPLGVPVAAGSGPNGDSGAANALASPLYLPTTISPGSAEQGADPFEWPKTTPIATSKGGSAKGFGSRSGGRHDGGVGAGHGKGGGRSRGSSHAGGRASSGHSGSKHSGGKGKGE